MKGKRSIRRFLALSLSLALLLSMTLANVATYAEGTNDEGQPTETVTEQPSTGEDGQPDDETTAEPDEAEAPPPDEPSAPAEETSPEASVEPTESAVPEASVEPTESAVPEASVEPTESTVPETSFEPTESAEPTPEAAPEALLQNVIASLDDSASVEEVQTTFRAGGEYILVYTTGGSSYAVSSDAFSGDGNFLAAVPVEINGSTLSAEDIDDITWEASTGEESATSSVAFGLYNGGYITRKTGRTSPENAYLSVGSKGSSLYYSEWIYGSHKLYSAQSTSDTSNARAIKYAASSGTNGYFQADSYGNGSSFAIYQIKAATQGLKLVDGTGVELQASTDPIYDYAASVLLTKTFTIAAEQTPSYTTDSVTWTSSDNGIATVSKGVVTPVAAGVATITATSGSVTKTCRVTVTEPVYETASGTDVSGLADSSTYIIVYETGGKYYALSGNADSSALAAQEVWISGSTISAEDIGIIKWVAGSTSTTDAFTLKNKEIGTNSAYLTRGSGSGSTLSCSAVGSTAAYSYWKYTSSQKLGSTSSSTRYITYANGAFSSGTTTESSGASFTLYEVDRKALTDISATNAVTAYTEGESFDSTGMIVTATYSDSSTAEVTGYTWSPTGALATTDTLVTISYEEGGVTKTCDVAITVSPATKTLSSIAVTTYPTKTVYEAGESFDPTDMVVTATYSDFSTAEVTGYTWSPSGALATTDTVITVSFEYIGVTKTAPVAITVAEPTTESRTVEAVSAITAGKSYIMVYQSGDKLYALSAESYASSGTEYRKAVEVTLSGSTLRADDIDAILWTAEAGTYSASSYSGYGFIHDGKYLARYTSSASNAASLYLASTKTSGSEYYEEWWLTSGKLASQRAASSSSARYVAYSSNGYFQSGSSGSSITLYQVSVEATGIVLTGNGIEAGEAGVSNYKIDVRTGKSVLLTAALEPAGATGIVTWSSSDETVATVSDGRITGKSVGQALITATLGSLSKTCLVTVTQGTVETATLTTASSFTAGKRYVIIYDDGDQLYALSAEDYDGSSGNEYRNAAEISISGSTLTADDIDQIVWQAEAGEYSSSGTYEGVGLLNGGEYLSRYATADNKDDLYLTATKGSTLYYSEWAVSGSNVYSASTTSSSNKRYIAYDEDGYFKTASSGASLTIYEVAITTVRATDLTLSGNGIAEDASNTYDYTLTIPGGQSVQLTAALSPTESTDVVTWASDREQVASVSAGGLVVGINEGTAVITAQANDDVQRTCLVTVTAATGETTYTKTESLVDGGSYVIVIGHSAMGTTSGSYVKSSNDYTYNGLLGSAVTISGDKITSDITDALIWTAAASGDGFTFTSNAGTYLYGAYDEDNDIRDLKLGSSAMAWFYLPDGTLAFGSADGEHGLTYTSESGYFSVGILATTDSDSAVEFYLVSNEPAVTGIALDKDTLLLSPGDQATLSAKVTLSEADAGATYQILWSSDDENTATVDTGLLTAHAVGTATITASVEIGGQTYFDTCTVSVANADKLIFFSDYHELPSTLTSILTTIANDGQSVSKAFFLGDMSVGISSSAATTNGQAANILSALETTLNCDSLTRISGNHDYDNTTTGVLYESASYCTFGIDYNDFNSASTISALRTYLQNIATRESKPVLFVISHQSLNDDRDNSYAQQYVDLFNEFGDSVDIIAMHGHNHTIGKFTDLIRYGEDMYVRGGSTATPVKFTYLTAGYIKENYSSIPSSISLASVGTTSVALTRYYVSSIGSTKTVARRQKTGEHEHSYVYSVTTKPTTAATGVLTGSCSCGATDVVTMPVINATNYTSAVTTEPTHTNKGVRTYTWVTANAAYGTVTFTEDIPATGHSFAYQVTTKPTAATTGVLTGSCSCGATDVVTMPSITETNYTSVVTTEPTHTNKGVRTYTWVTANAAYGTVTFTEDIPATGHNFTYAVTTRPTAATTGVPTGTCSCGATDVVTMPAITGTDYSSVVTTEPTHVEKGVRTYTWVTASAAFGTVTFTEDIPATGHNFSYAVTTKPTATTTGVLTGTCSCGATDVVTMPAITGTDYSSAITTVPTETQPGVRTYTWITANAAYGTVMFTEEIPAHPHSFTYAVTTNPTTTTTGVLTGSCSCGVTDVVTMPVITETNYTSVVTTEPTHAAKGVRTYTWITANAAYGTVTFTADIPATGHSFAYAVTTKPTATTTGILTGTCSCGATDVVTMPVITETDYSSVVTAEPTHVEKGVRTYTWVTANAAYGAVTFTAEIPATGHSFAYAVTTKPTAATTGVLTGTCSCGATDAVTMPVINETSYTSVVTTEPTHTNKGVRTYTWITASAAYGIVTFTAEIPATGHSFTYRVTTGPSKSAAGVLTGTCSCGATSTIALPVLSTADYDYAVLTPPTQTEDGTGRYIWKVTAYGTFSFDVVLPFAIPVEQVNMVGGDQVLQIGKSIPLSATVLPEDAANKSLVWTSSNAAVVEVSDAGVITARGSGSAIITATSVSNNLAFASCTVRTVKTFELTIASAYVKLGESVQINVLGLPQTDVAALKWSTSSSKIATISKTGAVKGVVPGTATITATAKDGSGKKAVVKITVYRPVSKVKLNKTAGSLIIGKTVQLTATISPSNATSKAIIWTTGDAAVATVSSKGLVTAVGKGQATITARAKYGANDSVLATYRLTVTPGVTSIAFVAPPSKLKSGEFASLAVAILPADARQDVTWSTSSSRIVSVTSSGVVKGVNPGTATITATAKDGSGKKAVVKITVYRPVSKVKLNKTAGSLIIGKTVQLTATISPSNATSKAIIWTTSDATVATVNSKGLVTAIGKGQATITARAKYGANDSVLATYRLTVTPGVTSIAFVAPPSKLKSGQSASLAVAILPADARQDVAWSTSSSRIVSVTSSGVVKGVNPGTATITATAKDGSGKKAVVKITVYRPVSKVKLNKTAGSLIIGKTVQLTATISPSNATSKAIIWTTGDAAVATVNSKGLVTAVGKGQATITARAKYGANDSVLATYRLTVTPGVTSIAFVAPPPTKITIGQSIALSVVVLPTDARQDVTWSTSNSKIATVSSSGVVKGIKAGTVTITATAKDGSGKKAVVKITVYKASTGVQASRSACALATRSASANCVIGKEGRVYTAEP